MNRVIALGFFDGVHLGHQALLTQAKHHADRLGLPAAVLSLDRHPNALLLGEEPPLLLTQAQRQTRLNRLGLETIFLPFDQALQTMPWEKFFQDILINTFHAAHVVCGENYRFGFKGEGTAEHLARQCREKGIGCSVVPAVCYEGSLISSTRIRALLAGGQVETANAMLGYAYRLTGTVCHGNALGRTLEAPTANVVPNPALALPQNGVYITRVQLPDGTCYPAVTNLGRHPTLGGDTLLMESFLQGFHGDLYGQEITAEFYRFLRPEQKFSGLEELKQEIKHNAAQAADYFTREVLL